jgi:AraC-like DNA-binding protein
MVSPRWWVRRDHWLWRNAVGERQVPLRPQGEYRPNRSSRRIAVLEHEFPCRFSMRGCHGAMHARIGTSPILLARPVQPAELVKCVRAVLRKERGKRCLGVDIARWLGMDPRSLERHLSSGGTTFREISRQVRLQASQRLLKQGASVSDVAKALGFSELSAFTHAFRRWSGETPSSWKLRHAPPKAERPRKAQAPRRITRP